MRIPSERSYSSQKFHGFEICSCTDRLLLNSYLTCIEIFVLALDKKHLPLRSPRRYMSFNIIIESESPPMVAIVDLTVDTTPPRSLRQAASRTIAALECIIISEDDNEVHSYSNSPPRNEVQSVSARTSFCSNQLTAENFYNDIESHSFSHEIGEDCDPRQDSDDDERTSDKFSPGLSADREPKKRLPLYFAQTVSV